MPSGSHLRRSLRRWLLGRPAWLGKGAPDSLLVFVHIPKAAGTSLNELFEQVYGRTFLNVSNHHPAWESRRPDPDGIFCLSGHVPYGWHRKLGAKGRTDWPGDGLFEGRTIRYVSIVRDPVDRFRSYYRYAKQEPKHRHHREVAGMSPREFLSFLDSIDDRGAWNQQFRMLGGLPGDRFHLVAPLDRLDRFVEVLGKSLGWPGGFALPHSNRSEGKDVDGFDDSLIAEIEARGPKDRELYDHVRDRFERGDFPAFREAGGTPLLNP